MINEEMTEKDIMGEDSGKDSEKKRREPRKSKKKRQPEQTLDTSELLRKKDDRSI